MTENLKTVAITDEDQLQAIAADWDRLLHNSKAFSPMITYAWISTYFSLRVRPGNRWVCLCAYRRDELAGVLPLLISSSKRFGLTFDLADYPHDATTLNGDVIVHDDDADDVVRELIDQAFALFPAVQMVRIRGVSDFSNVHRALPGRYIYECATTGEGAYLPIPASFDEFRASLSKNFRSNLNKARNHSKRAGAVSFAVDSTSENRAEFLEEFMDIEAANWKGDSGSAIKMSSELRQWYGTLLPRLEASGMLEWQTMRIDESYAAANMCIRTPRKVFLWKLGYDNAFNKCSPGSLLLEHVIETESEKGQLESIELLTSYRWYDNWKMATRPTQSVSFFRRSAKGRLLHLASQLRSWLQQKRKGEDRPNRHAA